MTQVRNDALNLALDTEDNPYLLDGYAPIDTEITAEDLGVVPEFVRASHCHLPQPLGGDRRLLP